MTLTQALTMRSTLNDSSCKNKDVKQGKGLVAAHAEARSRMRSTTNVRARRTVGRRPLCGARPHLFCRPEVTALVLGSAKDPVLMHHCFSVSHSFGMRYFDVHAEYASVQVLGVPCAPAEFTTDAAANSPATLALITKTLRMLSSSRRFVPVPHNPAFNLAAYHDRRRRRRQTSHYRR